MRIYKIFMKLMSKHLVFHLLLPLAVGFVFEAFIAFYGHPFRDGLRHLALAGGTSYLPIFLTFLVSAGWLIQNEAKPPWDNILTETLDEVLSDATDVFATCTIPLKEWFHPYTQQYLSYIVKHNVNGKSLPQKRVLLFKEQEDLAKAREQYLDGQFAKPLADIHRNYGIPLGFLRPNEMDEILEGFRLIAEARSWKKPNARDHEASEQQERDGTISTLDFALVTHPGNRITVITFDKTGDIYKLVPIEDPVQVKPYETLRDKIVTRVFNQKGANPQHNFSAFSGACGSATFRAPAPQATA